MQTVQVSDFIADRLKKIYNVEHFFMVSGGGAMHLNNSLGCHLPYICNHNEQASAIAAEGYARIEQKLAVVNVTTGPGGLNCLNGVFGQWTDSVPVLYISGQVKFTTTLASCPNIPLRQLGDQEVDIVSVVSPLVKYAKMVTDPLEIGYHLDAAIHAATTGRFGPVWLDIPMDVQGAMIDTNKLKVFTPPAPLQSDLQLGIIIEKLESAKRPVIVAGHGIRLAGQVQNFYQLLKKLEIPVVTTFNGFDIMPCDHPLVVGRIGTVGQRAGNFALQNADVVLCLGTRNNIRQVSYNYENFAKNAFIIAVDVDYAELEKPTVAVDLGICADLKSFLPQFLKQAPVIKKTDWLQWCIERKNCYSYERTIEYQQNETSELINPYTAVRTLTELMDSGDAIVLGNGSACVCTFQAAQVKENQRFILNSGDASMGYDLPAALGACIARGKKKTICLAGDGSLMMNIQELETVKHHNLPIKIIILNNNGYVSIRQTHTNFFGGKLTGCSCSSGVSIPDFCAVAQAFGLPAYKLTNASTFKAKLANILDMPGPVLCEIMIEEEYTFSPKLSARRLENGTMVSPSLEDMSPFLSSEELQKNLIK